MSIFPQTKILRSTGFLNGRTDFHSHVLPGVDDGIRKIEDSLRALKTFEEAGLRELWLTPHIMEDVPNTPEHLRDVFASLSEAYTGPIKLHLAAENMLDSLFEKRLKSGILLPIGKGQDHLLVETSYFNPPSNFDSLLAEINSAGLYILLAHPERYIYMDKDDYKSLIDRGVKFQINYGSLTGFYGDTAKKKAEWLLKEGYVTVFGSDMHRNSALARQLDGKASAKAVDRLIALPEPEF